MTVDRNVATNAAAKRNVPGARDQKGPCVRAEKTVRKSDTEIFRYMAHMSWP